jgi:hypothetical protein
MALSIIAGRTSISLPSNRTRFAGSSSRRNRAGKRPPPALSELGVCLLGISALRAGAKSVHRALVVSADTSMRAQLCSLAFADVDLSNFEIRAGSNYISTFGVSESIMPA